MKRIKELFNEHNYVVLIAIFMIAIVLVWSFNNSFSETVSDSAWDGVVATSFTSGTGTEANPYVISSASEYAYFKSLLEGENASVYIDKNYVIASGFNYGEYDISVNNTVPFEGTIDGNYNLIYNANITNYLFASLDNANIKNLNFSDMHITVSDNTGIIAREIEKTDIAAISLYGTIDENDSTEITVGGIAYTDSDSTFRDLVIDIDNSLQNYVSLVVEIDDTEFDYVFVNANYDKVVDSTGIDLTTVYEIDYNGNNNIQDNDDYILSMNNNMLMFSKKANEVNNSEDGSSNPSKAPLRSSQISLHNSGIDTSTHSIYINDLVSDGNYYNGLNYTEIRNTTGAIPTGNNQNLYTSSNLATVYIRYSSADINDDTIYGSVSVSEDIRDYYYYKKYPVENGYVTFDLIDNPWANRPTDMAFNGWVTDYTGAVISLDMDVYVRSVKIPVSDVTNPISITFYSSWTVASVVTSTNFNNLKSVGMNALSTSYGDLTVYYVTARVNNNSNYPNNAGNLYDLNGNRITGGSTCRTSGGCTYLRINTNNTYNSNTAYYSVTPNGNNTATVERVYPQLRPISYYTGGSAAGYYIRVNSGTENIYSSTGVKQDSCSGTCYKLLQYSDGNLTSGTTYYYLTTRDTNIFAPTSTNNINVTNINSTKPMTVTGIHNGADNSNNRTLRISSDWEISADIRIEFIRFYISSTTTNVDEFTNNNGYEIIGNFKNVKLGRGLKRNGSNLTASGFVGGAATNATSLTNYSLIVESGFYQNGSAVGYDGAYTHRVFSSVILGNDYDRIANNNSNLIVYYCYAGSWGSNLYNSSSSSNTYDTPAIYTVVKSGSFGTNKADYAAGIYVGGRASGSHYALREVLVEGGYIYNLIGGPSSADDRASKNDIIINVKGGEIDLIFGGAGASDTVGNKILNITGGTVNYGIVGGSNAYTYGQNTSNPNGKIDGDTLLYVGGNVLVGTKNDSLFTISSGDVYGAGNGRANESTVGAVNNANVIIGPSATIKGSVYGGGNNGAVGGNTTGVTGSGSTVASSGVYEDATTDNSIRYYGPNPDNYIQFNGELYRIVGLFNNVSTQNGSKDLIRIVKNTSLGNRAWGDANMTTVATNTSTETTSGYFANNTYNYTNYYKNYYNFYVKNDNTKSNMYNYLNTTYYNGLNNTYKNYIEEVNWGLGATSGVNQNASSFYAIERGSGVVNYLTGINQTGNGNSLYSSSFKVGLFYPSDYGYANNDSTCLSSSLGSYSSNCRTNNWMSGMTNAWTMTSSTDVTDVTKTYQVSSSGNWFNGYTYTMNRYYHVSNRNFVIGTNGLELKDIYYTNNDNDANNYYNTGAVYPSFYLKDDVTIISGTGTSTDPYVIGTSEVLLTDIVYELMHPAESSEPQTITHSESEYMAKTHIQILGGTISGSVYGAGNSNGAGNNNNNMVALAKIMIDVTGGDIDGSVYGGANAFGTVYGDVFVNITDGDVAGSIYGGGKGGYDQSGDGTYVTDNVFVTIGDNNTNNLTIHGNVYGGSAFGTVNAVDQNTNTSDYATYVTVNDGVIVGSVFGGGQGDSTHTPRVVGNINVTINGGDITSVFGGNDQAGVHDKYNKVTLNGGVIDYVYGGGNRSSVTTTNVDLKGSTVTNIYGGSNALGDVTTANVNIKTGSVQTVYGGNNVGGTCGVTNVVVEGSATVGGAIYGGGNQVNTTTTNITLNSAGGTIPNVYGGGSSASVGTSNVTKNGTTVTNLFGGSNTSGTVTDSYITHAAGATTNLYGGNNAGGNTVTSHISVTGGTVTTVYGGGNQANGSTSNVGVSGGTVTTIFGGGNNAGVTTSNVTVNGGTVTDVYGGSNNSGTVTTANVLIDTTGTIGNVYGGGNRAQVGTTNVVLDGGTIGNIYGGGNLAQVTGNTVVDINGGTINTNVYGGGNFGVVQGSSYVTITDATILGSAYAGGNGSTATLEGDTNITVDGNTVIGTVNSVTPTSGCVFGGGNQAYTGTSANNNSTSNVAIVGGTIYGNVYGGANTSVIYGNTIVNIGKTAYTSNDLQKTDIYIKGHVFGGGEANASGSEIYDWSFISVTEGANITIDADTYNNFQIDGSFFGGGNASTAAGDSYLLIRNYGSGINPKRNVSIQRVTYVTIDNSSILLSGAIDRANDYNDELFTISRVEDFKLKNNSYLFLTRGANLLKDFKSLDAQGNPAVVTIDVDDNEITNITVDNRIYLYEGRQLNIAKDQQGNDCGNVIGMTFFGIFNFASGNVSTGMYNPIYEPGDTLNNSLLFSKGSVIKGKHMTNHDITVNGFYSNYMNAETSINEINYVEPSPKNAQHYVWHIGENVVEYNVNLTASKYSTLGSVEFPFDDLYKPNTSFQIDSFDISDIASGISLVDKSNIPRIASTPAIANSVFGLAMEASNSGWLTTGKTSFYTSDPFMSGVTYYEGENSNVVPTMLFYLYHSKNLTETKSLGTVRISITAITKISALASEVTRLVVNVNMSSAFYQTEKYEGSMTPGDKYDLFTSTATNITTKSKFSAYFGLYSANTNLYQTGYHRALTSSYVLPVGTKITMLDFSLGTPEYYYHVITANDVAAAQTEFQQEGECSYNLSMFTKMGSLNSNTNYNDAAKNLLYYDGTDSSEEFIFIVDFSDTTISGDQMANSLLLEMRDAGGESTITVLGIQHDQLVYNLYSGLDSAIDITATVSDNPLYIGYSDIFDVVINYQNSSLSGVAITDTQYFDSKLGVQVYLINNEGNVVSGTDLTGTYFTMDGVRYYPDIAGYTHIKLADKVGNTEKWLIFNTENSNLATGSYTVKFESFASPDGIYYSSGTPDYYTISLQIINSTYGLNPVIDDNSVIFSADNDKSFDFTLNYTSLLTAPNIRIVMYRREYDEVYDTGYRYADFQDFVTYSLTPSYNVYEYIIDTNPLAQKHYTFPFESELTTGTYRISFRLYDGDTLIGDINRYIIVK